MQVFDVFDLNSAPTLKMAGASKEFLSIVLGLCIYRIAYMTHDSLMTLEMTIGMNCWIAEKLYGLKHKISTDIEDPSIPAKCEHVVDDQTTIES